MTNFDFLTKDPQFHTFSDVAINAEKVFAIDFESSAVNARRAMEFAVKWMYSIDSSLVMPSNTLLVGLTSAPAFKSLVGKDMLKRMEFIRKVGNNTTHNAKSITKEQAFTSLLNLFIFLDFVAVCYSKNYEKSSFKPSLLESHALQNTQKKDLQAQKLHTLQNKQEAHEIELEKLIQENEALKEELTKRREAQEKDYIPTPLDLSEYETRKIYIDTMLADLGLVQGTNWINEVRVSGMPNNANEGFIDYVLYDDSHKPLAIIEAKRTGVEIEKGRQQAKLYADALEKEYGYRPVIFLSNGFDFCIIDGKYPEREVASIYSKRDLEKLYNLRKSQISLVNVHVSEAIANRYYQKAAIGAVCESFEKNRRKALLVMATGSGKTRTIIGLCDVLLHHGFVKNILFLADRTALVKQAKKNFVNLLPNLSTVNLCIEKDNFQANAVFSTYQSIMACIDEVTDNEEKLFTSGHFDLVVCDEAHRSIYNKYKDIFTYFDAPLVGLTATPKDEVDKNTYEIFHLENGNPTYNYELAQAVTDGFLVPYKSVETSLKFLEQGISYDELPENEKEAYENLFEDSEMELPTHIASSALNKWVFNENTIKQVLHILMTQGIHIDYGNKIGKTIIFAKNHKHAEKIFEVFNKEYPHLKDYAMVIDNYINYAESAIDDFSTIDKLPQIAISVDMLDTGIDVPEVLNLVFFKKVMSKAKFWQMIGRGTRLCEKFLDGEDKKEFYIFDFCGNFEFFRMSQGKESPTVLALQGALFNLKANIVLKLQNLEYQTEELILWRKKLVAELVNKVSELNVDNFAVKQHLRYVKKYCKTEHYMTLCEEDVTNMKTHIVPLVLPDCDETSALRFDALLYGIELASLANKPYSKAKSDLLRQVKNISSVANIPEIMAQADLIHKIIHTNYLEGATIDDFEHIRANLRHLMKYLQKSSALYTTNFTDEILSSVWNDPEFENNNLANYKEKAEFYIREHQDEEVIKKLKSNLALTKHDIEELEQILWSEVGTQDDYLAQFGEKPLGEFVREIVGLDMNTAKEAFSAFLNDTRLDSRQIHFVNHIIEYIVHNGMLKDFRILQSSPFTDKGSIVEVFDDISLWNDIKRVIDGINANVELVA